MEVNSSKYAQGKVTFRTSERRRYPERGSHPHILIGQCSTVARTYWVHCTRGARFDLLIMLPEISDAHTPIRYARDSKRNVGCDVGERRDADKNDTRGSITRPIIASEFDDTQENFVSMRLICSKDSDYKLRSLHL